MIDWDRFSESNIRNRIANKFPAFLASEDGSANQLLLSMIADQQVADAKLFKDIYQAIWPENLAGVPLEKYAADWGVTRIDSDDEYLKFLIRLAKMKSHMGVTEDDLIRFISFTTGADPSEFHIITDADQLGGDPMAIKVTGIPAHYISDERRTRLLLKIIQSVVPATVRVIDIEYAAQVDGNLWIGSLMTVFNKVELESDVDNDTYERTLSDTAYMRAVHQVSTSYTIESEEVN
ncbi:hypothetical protein [Lactobacillus brevis] [Lactiplantibacillus mudanjiangensis]|uniref:hypothetical protein n=1 Tax=Lactiplantibacillus mudanjiangensis TaxID=1296538 RepID=UPI001015636C|nr:hypothetical protein [Lactiplantibacillus mudanjiangensis]VDG32894.1 hypothetical protein [Lactobacillus brevis] [Lactiplantibacillus mudanjiangensis]